MYHRGFFGRRWLYHCDAFLHLCWIFNVLCLIQHMRNRMILWLEIHHKSCHRKSRLPLFCKKGNSPEVNCSFICTWWLGNSNSEIFFRSPSLDSWDLLENVQSSCSHRTWRTTAALSKSHSMNTVGHAVAGSKKHSAFEVLLKSSWSYLSPGNYALSHMELLILFFGVSLRNGLWKVTRM